MSLLSLLINLMRLVLNKSIHFFKRKIMLIPDFCTALYLFLCPTQQGYRHIHIRVQPMCFFLWFILKWGHFFSPIFKMRFQFGHRAQVCDVCCKVEYFWPEQDSFWLSFITCFPFEYIFKCNLFLWCIITPVFSVTWSSEIILIYWFAAQETFLIYYQCWKQFCFHKYSH